MKRTLLFSGIALVSAFVSILCPAYGSTHAHTMNELERKIEKADTPGKKEAITHIRDLFREYDRHYDAMRIADYILETKNDPEVLAKLADYAIGEGSFTMDYIGIAKCAAQSKYTSKEFLDLASLVKYEGCYGRSLIGLAKKIADAKNESELEPLRAEIAALTGTVDLFSNSTHNGVENDHIVELGRMLERADSPGKKRAIAHIRNLFMEYDRHYDAMKIADYILEADCDHAVVLAKLADYAVREGSGTSVYIAIAEQAARAPHADPVFLKLAKRAKRQGWGSAKLIEEAKKAASEK